MIEGYSTEEVIESFLGYLKDNVSLGLSIPRFLGRLKGVGTVGREIFIDKDFKGVQQTHYTILQQTGHPTPRHRKKKGWRGQGAESGGAAAASRAPEGRRRGDGGHRLLQRRIPGPCGASSPAWPVFPWFPTAVG